MTDFSQNYFNLKRTVLIFAALTLLFCVPGANVSGLNVAGIALGGVSFELLLFFVAMAALYYGVLFAMTAYVDAKYSLVSLERNEADLRALLEKYLGRVTSSIVTLTSAMERAVSILDSDAARKKLDEIDALISEGRVVISERSVFYRQELERSALFNLLSNHILLAERSVPASRQLKMHEMKDEVLKALESDMPALVHRAVVESAMASWNAVRQSVVESTESVDKRLSVVLAEMHSHAEQMSGERDAISNLLLQVKVLSSVRSVRFWVMEVGIVGFMLLTAIAHYLGRFFIVFPSPFGAI